MAVRLSHPAGSLLLLALALLIGAMDGLLLPDSLIYPWNRTLGLVLAGLALLAGSGLLRAGRRGIAAAFLAAAMYALWQIAVPWVDRAVVLAQTGPAAREVERHFVIGYADLATARERVRDAHIGGLFLTQRNVAGRSRESVAAEIAELQALRHVSGLPPLIVTADQEGGAVAHLTPPLPLPPALSTLAGLPAGGRGEAARRLGREVGSQLRQVGVTMDLAPVVDLMPRGRPLTLDLHTHLVSRAISADPATVAEVSSAFAAGLQEVGVTPTAKHFPGLSRVPADTHLSGASLQARKEELEAADWVPFRAVLQVPGSALMVAHVTLLAVDREAPVSRSRAVVAGLLREEWRFEGVVITDDLTMGAVEHAGLCKAVEGALNAGVDLLLVSWDPDKVYPAMRCALDALRAGRLDREMLRRSARRLDQLGKDPIEKETAASARIPARRKDPDHAGIRPDDAVRERPRRPGMDIAARKVARNSATRGVIRWPAGYPTAPGDEIPGRAATWEGSNEQGRTNHWTDCGRSGRRGTSGCVRRHPRQRPAVTQGGYDKNRRNGRRLPDPGAILSQGSSASG